MSGSRRSVSCELLRNKLFRRAAGEQHRPQYAVRLRAGGRGWSQSLNELRAVRVQTAGRGTRPVGNMTFLAWSPRG